MFEKTRMPFQTDVFAARAPYSFEGAVKKFHLFPVKDLIAGRFRDTSLVPSPCLLARRDFFFSHLLIYLLRVASFGRVTASSPLPRRPMRDRTHHAPGSTSLTLFEQQCGFFYMYFSLQLVKEDEGDKANGLMSPPN